jgi:hypothetical protein
MRFNPRLSTGRWKLVACVACSWSFNLLGFQWFSWKIEAMPDLSRFKIIKATCFFLPGHFQDEVNYHEFLAAMATRPKRDLGDG